VARGGLCQSVPADHAFGVFAAIEFQKLQMHGLLFLSNPKIVAAQASLFLWIQQLHILLNS
jgi:hypothetical protein